MNQPFGTGQVSVGIHSPGGSATAMLDHLFEQARAAEASGWAGVSVSEHHGGLGSHLPNPLQVSGWLLPELEHAWAAPCPLLLPLRNPALVAEELAWLAARHPGRVGLAVGPGYAPIDFALLEVPLGERLARHREGLELLARTLAGRPSAALAGDLALAAAPTVPVVATLGGPVGAAHAGGLGVGAMVDSFAGDAKVRALFARYADAGGQGPRIVCRRAWLGSPDDERLAGLARMYLNAGSGSAIGPPETDVVATRDPEEMAETLARETEAGDADALLIRVYFPGIEPREMCEQVQAIGESVLPLLRTRLGWPAPVATIAETI